MVGLTAERQFELRARKKLEAGETDFVPTTEANKAIFEKNEGRI